MQIKVIKVTRDGKTGYLRSASLFAGGDSIAESPLEARNYNVEGDLDRDLEMLKISGDEWVAMSGVPVDSAHVVEFEVSLQEVSIREGRPLHKE